MDILGSEFRTLHCSHEARQILLIWSRGEHENWRRTLTLRCADLALFFSLRHNASSPCNLCAFMPCNTLVAVFLLFKHRAQNTLELLEWEGSWRKNCVVFFSRYPQNIFCYHFQPSAFSYFLWNLSAWFRFFHLHFVKNKKVFIGARDMKIVLFSSKVFFVKFVKMLLLVRIHKFSETRTNLIILWFRSSEISGISL